MTEEEANNRLKEIAAKRHYNVDPYYTRPYVGFYGDLTELYEIFLAGNRDGRIEPVIHEFQAKIQAPYGECTHTLHFYSESAYKKAKLVLPSLPKNWKMQVLTSQLILEWEAGRWKQ